MYSTRYSSPGLFHNSFAFLGFASKTAFFYFTPQVFDYYFKGEKSSGERTHPWGVPVRCRCWDNASQPHLLSPIGEGVVNPQRCGGATQVTWESFVFQDFWVKRWAEVHKRDPCICPWGVKVLEIKCIPLHHPPTCLPGGQTSGGPAGRPLMSFRWFSVSL